MVPKKIKILYETDLFLLYLEKNHKIVQVSATLIHDQIWKNTYLSFSVFHEEWYFQ